MAAILADGIFKCIFLNENDKIPIQIFIETCSHSPIDNTPALVQVMAWHRTGAWTNDDQFRRHIYAVLGGDELIAITAFVFYVKKIGLKTRKFFNTFIVNFTITSTFLWPTMTA